jgi:hypothetical protein
MLFYLRLWEGTDQFVYLLAILEEKKSGDALDAVLGGSGGIVIRVQFDNLDSAGIIRGQLVHDGGHHAARAAPGRPAIHKDWTGKREHLFTESAVRNLNRVTGKVF